MRCWNCNREIPPGAKICSSCEAPIDADPTREEIEEARDCLAQLPPEVISELRDVAFESETAEEFADRILVGDCPKCGSEDTGHCENDPDIQDLLVGRCYDCGQLFCTECSRLLEPQAATCDCWDDDLPWDPGELPGE